MVDAITIDQKSRKINLISHGSSVSDNKTNINHDGSLSIKQAGKNNITVVGKGGLKSLITVQSHGPLLCNGAVCKAKKGGINYVPSLKAVNTVDDASLVLNDAIVAGEGFIEKMNPITKEKKPRMESIGDVTSVEIRRKGTKFSVTAGDKTMLVNDFLLDPLIVKSVEIEEDSSKVTANVSKASCLLGRNKMKVPTKTVLLCSDGWDNQSTYKLKSYFSVYKEQLESVRGMRFGKKLERMHVGFGRSTNCRVVDGRICCVQSGDDDEICY